MFILQYWSLVNDMQQLRFVIYRILFLFLQDNTFSNKHKDVIIYA